MAIPPFNYPVNLAVSKIGPALIAGNALVLKPPTQVNDFFDILKYPKKDICKFVCKFEADAFSL